MAKKVEIVALVSVLGQPSYDKSRWANFFGEKLAKVTKGMDKIAAIMSRRDHCVAARSRLSLARILFQQERSCHG